MIYQTGGLPAAAAANEGHCVHHNDGAHAGKGTLRTLVPLVICLMISLMGTSNALSPIRQHKHRGCRQRTSANAQAQVWPGLHQAAQRPQHPTSCWMVAANDGDADADAGDQPQASSAMAAALSSSFASSSVSSNLRFLGRGADAIVRPGVVLLSPKEEYDHFLRRSAVFIYAMGHDDHDVYVIRGVILDHPTPFTVREMIDEARQGPPSATDAPGATSDPQADQGADAIMENLVFRGGRTGDDASVAMFHCNESLANRCGSEMIGTSGIYQGGFATLFDEQGEAYASAKRDGCDPEDFKFFFNYVEFTEQELENMLCDVASDGDAWVSVEVPAKAVLDSMYDRGDAWSRLRTLTRQD